MTRSALLLAALLAACTAPTTPPRPAAEPASDASTLAGLSDDTDYRAFFEGAWTADAPDGGVPGLACPKALDVQFGETQIFCVVPNQVWITARWALDEDARQAHLYLVGPDDVGAGGARMPWDAFRRDTPIATMEQALGEGRFATVTWHGFRTRAGAVSGDDLGAWYDGDYTPADGDTRIPTRSDP